MIRLLISVSLACTVTGVKTDCWCKLDAGYPANTQELQGVRNTAKTPVREGIMVKSLSVSPSTGDANMCISRTPLRKQRFYLRAAIRSSRQTSRTARTCRAQWAQHALLEPASLHSPSSASCPSQTGSCPCPLTVHSKKKTQNTRVLPSSVWKNNFLMIKCLHCTYLTEKLRNSLTKHSQPNTVSSKIYF